MFLMQVPIGHVSNLFDFRTFKREVTFHDGKDGHPKGVCHIPIHPAYNEKLRQVCSYFKYEIFQVNLTILNSLPTSAHACFF